MFSPTWRLLQGEEVIATLRQKLLSLRPCWQLLLDGQRFCINGKLLSLRRQYTVAGGPFDGALISGSLLDRSFRIEHNGVLLADARVRWISLVDAQQVSVHSDDPAVERFVALAMLVVQLARQRERRRSAQ